MYNLVFNFIVDNLFSLKIKKFLKVIYIYIFLQIYKFIYLLVFFIDVILL